MEAATITPGLERDAMAAFHAAHGSPSGRTHLDVFSGIGGFALAAQAAGYSTIGFSEIEPYACKILKRHWPDVPNYGDIRNVRNIRADLITGGFPCQPFSLAGKRLGQKDDRHLWPEMCRVIGEARPTWVLGENVPGIISLELDRVLSDLESLGYSVWPFAIPACALDARHRRERIWIVGHANGERCDRQRVSILAGRPLQAGAETDGTSPAVADATGERKQKPADKTDARANGRQAWNESGNGGEPLSNAARQQARRIQQRPLPAYACASRDGANAPAAWATEPELGRVADGIPNRAHRLRGLGNAIVPQVAETLIRMMARMENDEMMSRPQETNKP